MNDLRPGGNAGSFFWKSGKPEKEREFFRLDGFYGGGRRGPERAAPSGGKKREFVAVLS